MIRTQERCWWRFPAPLQFLTIPTHTHTLSVHFNCCYPTSLRLFFHQTIQFNAHISILASSRYTASSLSFLFLCLFASHCFGTNLYFFSSSRLLLFSSSSALLFQYFQCDLYLSSLWNLSSAFIWVFFPSLSFSLYLSGGDLNTSGTNFTSQARHWA